MRHFCAFENGKFCLYVMQYVHMYTFDLCNQELIKHQLCEQDRSEKSG